MPLPRSFPWPAAWPDRIIWSVLAVGALGTVGSLVRFWGIRTEYADRFLVILGAAWAAYHLLPAALAVPVRPRPLLALPLLLAGGALVPFGWFLQVQTTGGRAAILWFQGGGLILLAGGCVIARYGYGRLRVLAFPLMFATFALPIPSIIAAPLQAQLQDVTTALAENALPLLGVPVLRRDGFVLRLAGGDLGVAEACSGIRSMTALTALAAFLAYLRGLGILRGIALEAATVPIVAAVNGVRVVASGVIQERFGDRYIRGDWHEALGLVMVFLGLGIIVRVARLVGRGVVEDATPPPAPLPEAERGSRKFGQGFALAAVALAAGITGLAIAKGVTANARFVATAPLAEMPLVVGRGRDRWTGTEKPVPDFITEILGQDQAILREYENNTGQRVYVWVLFWSTAEMVKGYHHPDVCWGNKGYVSTAKRLEPIAPTNGGTIPATVREFVKDHDGGKTKEHQYVVYWTQEGAQVWGERDELNAQAGGFFFDPALWFGDYRREANAVPNGRIVVLLGTPSVDPVSKAETLRFAKAFADELYALCPWAGPPHPTAR